MKTDKIADDVKKKTGGFINEFKAFIARGNVIDLAVGVIIGGAFSDITNSLVNDMVMPLLGIFTNSISFSDLSFEIPGTSAVITYGNFVQAVLNFLIMAFVVFCLVKAINSFHRKKEEDKKEEPKEPEPTKEELLLTEIRDILKEQSSNDA